MPTKLALLFLPASLLAACVGGDDAPVADTEQALGPVIGGPIGGPVATPPTPPPCTPAPPINPNLCDPYEPAPPPPPINGKCTIDIRATAVGFWTGQGWLEGRAEAVTHLTATDLSTGAMTMGSYPSSGTIKMDVDKEQIANIDLGTYVVEEHHHKNIQLCATFIEDDPLDADDSGFDCTTVQLSCPEAGEDVTLSADLCKGGDCTKLAGRMTADIEVLTADADRDCVPNPVDWTDDVCDEAFKGQLCHASLVHFAYEESPFVDLIQFIGTDLSLAMTGYDKVILLIDDDDVGPFNLNPAAMALADVVMEPSEANFFAALRDLTSEGCRIDVWDFSHGSPDWDDATPGTVAFVGGGSITTGDDDEHQLDANKDPDITSDELLAATDPAVSGTPSVPILMTYATACNYSEWNQAWLDVGAKTTSGSRDINFKPTNYPYFAVAWNANATYGNSVGGEATLAAENLAFTFLSAEGALPPYLCIGNTILGKNNCAFNYFTDVDQSPVYDASGELGNDGPDTAKYGIGGPLYDIAGISYDGTVSGAVNMRRSSVKLVVGTSTVRKNSAGLVWP